MLRLRWSHVASLAAQDSIEEGKVQASTILVLLPIGLLLAKILTVCGMTGINRNLHPQGLQGPHTRRWQSEQGKPLVREIQWEDNLLTPRAAGPKH